MNRKKTLDISFSSKTGRKHFKPLPVSVQNLSSKCASQSQEPGLQNNSPLVEGVRTSTPKTSRSPWEGLRRTLAMINTQIEGSTTAPRQNKENSVLNESWPRSTPRRKIEPLPMSVSAKKRCIRGLKSEFKLTHSQSENHDQFTSATTPNSYQKPWNRLTNTMSSLLMPNSICGEDFEDVSIEYTPNTQVTLTERLINQSTPTTVKKSTAKSKVRCVKGGFVQEYKKMLENMSMECRHLNLRKPSHTVNILQITESFGVKMALVRSESEPESGPSIFNIILSSDLTDNVIVGSRLQLYLDEEPIQLANKQIVHLQSNKMILL